MKKLVLDTNVMVAALRSPNGASSVLLEMALDKAFIMLASVPLFFEYDAKCTDPKHWTEAGLTFADAQNFVKVLAALIHPVEVHYLWRPMLKDPKDEMVLECAVNGGAESIVTFNVRDFGTAPHLFNIDVVTPAFALRSLRNE